MDLADILSPQQINPNMKASDRWEAIDELIDQLVSVGKIKTEHRAAILASVRKRETSMSTGIGYGVGIPHASTDLIYEVVAALGRSPLGIQFDSLDNQPVNVVMLFLVPQGHLQKHLRTLSDIAKLLHRQDFRRSFESAADSETIYQAIKANKP